MGRLIGKRPDATAAIAKAIRRHLRPGERVLAGVHLQRPATNSAQLSGGTSGGVAGALGIAPSVRLDRDPRHDGWLAQAAAFGIDEQLARRSSFLSLALTPSRLLLVRRSRLTRRSREVVGTWSLTEIDAIKVPTNGSTVGLRRAAAELTLELPQSHRFLPQVYRDLPRLFECAVEQHESSF